MPAAPNLIVLFDFEGQFEAASVPVLAASGITGYISQQAVKLPLPYTGIAADAGPAKDQLTFLPSPPGWTGESPPQDYYVYPLNLSLLCEVPRDANGAVDPNVPTFLAELRARIRAAFMRILMPFDDTNLPYYRVTDIRPNGAQVGYDAKRNVDFVDVRFLITFEIKPDSWPAWTP